MNVFYEIIAFYFVNSTVHDLLVFQLPELLMHSLSFILTE